MTPNPAPPPDAHVTSSSSGTAALASGICVVCHKKIGVGRHVIYWPSPSRRLHQPDGWSVGYILDRSPQRVPAHGRHRATI